MGALKRITSFCDNFLFHRIEKGLEKEGVLEFLENLAKLITPEYIDALYLKTYQILEEMGYTTDKLVRFYTKKLKKFSFSTCLPDV